MVITKRK